MHLNQMQHTLDSLNMSIPFENSLGHFDDPLTQRPLGHLML